MTRNLGLGTLGVLATLGLATTALANGRFPHAERLVEDPNDSNQLYLAGTYGIVATSDRGASWYMICEASFAQSAGYTGDPLLDITSDGSLIVGVQTSIALSTDRGCNWVPTLEETLVVDHALARSEPGRIVAAVNIATDGGARTELRESLDSGRSWEPIGQPLPVDLVYTIDVDPTDSERLYASGIVDQEGVLATSVDRGATWTVHPIPGTGPNSVPYISAIDPRDSNKIFVRLDSGLEVATRGDALLHSDDGGVTFREIHRSKAQLLGFALSPDASKVIIGYGEPGFGDPSAPGPFGVFESATDGFSFERVHGGRVNGLAWTKTGIYVSSAEAQDGYELAFSPVDDFREDGGCLVPLFHLREIKGPLACPASTSTAVCVAEWSNTCLRLGACSEVVPQPKVCVPFDPPGTISTDGGAEGSRDGASGGGGESDQGAARESGCHCTMGSRSEHEAAPMGLAYLLLASISVRSSSARTRPRSSRA